MNIVGRHVLRLMEIGAVAVGIAMAGFAIAITQRSIDRLDLREMLGRRSAALSPRSSNIQIRMVTSWLPLVALPQATASLNR